MQYMIHVGNILYLCAYLVRDILWLRVITVVAAISFLPYYYSCQATPMYAPIAWLSLFTLVNLFQIVILFFERCPVYLGEDELRVYRALFRSLTPREFVKLMRTAESRRAAAGDLMLEKDAQVDTLMLLLSGRASVMVGRQRIAGLEQLQFVGEMAFLTGHPASARVVADEPTDYLAWSVVDLHK
jgi:hypothetical protein